MSLRAEFKVETPEYSTGYSGRQKRSVAMFSAGCDDTHPAPPPGVRFSLNTLTPRCGEESVLPGAAKLNVLCGSWLSLNEGKFTVNKCALLQDVFSPGVNTALLSKLRTSLRRV